MIRTTNPDGTVTVQFTAEEYVLFAAAKLDGIADAIKLHDLQARCVHEFKYDGSYGHNRDDWYVCSKCGKATDRIPGVPRG